MAVPKPARPARHSTCQRDRDGLPHQTHESFNETLDTVLEMQPDRLAVFSYAHVPWIKPAQKILEHQHHLPTPETKLDILKLVIEKLT